MLNFCGLLKILPLQGQQFFDGLPSSRGGGESLKDDAHPGRPPTAVIPETVAMVEKLLREEGRLTYSMLQDSVKIGSAAINTILHEQLEVRKVGARWVPHCLTVWRIRLEFHKLME